MFSAQDMSQNTNNKKINLIKPRPNVANMKMQPIEKAAMLKLQDNKWSGLIP